MTACARCGAIRLSERHCRVCNWPGEPFVTNEIPQVVVNPVLPCPTNCTAPNGKKWNHKGVGTQDIHWEPAFCPDCGIGL